MNLRHLKSLLLKIALALHNTATFIALNILMWRNNLWRKEKWTKKYRQGETGETSEKGKTSVEQATPAMQETLETQATTAVQATL